MQKEISPPRRLKQWGGRELWALLAAVLGGPGLVAGLLTYKVLPPSIAFVLSLVFTAAVIDWLLREKAVSRATYWVVALLMILGAYFLDKVTN